MNTRAKKFALAVHGGAGTIDKLELTPGKEKMYNDSLREALEAGDLCLRKGKSALDAVCEAVCVLENNPFFNAGKGAVFTHEGRIELDASVMDGSNLMAGAIAGAVGIKNPVLLARAVMEQTEHVLLSGNGLNEFIDYLQWERYPQSYFYTDLRFQQLQKAIKEGKTLLDHGSKPIGTVGAVALDLQGNIAAATSTGGMTNKRFGRVGDTPIIGAGLYADNNSCAVSCTGHGEYFMKHVAAYAVAALIKLTNISLNNAAHKVVNEILLHAGGEGGLIAINTQAEIEMPFNSAGMYRGKLNSEGELFTAIF